MILVSIGTPQRPVRLVFDELAGIAWSSTEDCPVITLKSGAILYALGFSTQHEEEREQKVVDLEARLLEAWRKGNELTSLTAAAQALADITEPGILRHLPPDPVERAVRDVSPLDAPMISHDKNGTQHLDDPVRRRNCRICTPGGTMGSDPAAT